MKKKAFMYILGILVLMSPVSLAARETGLAITSVTVHRPAQKKKRTENPKVTMDFNDVDIKDFIKVISKITGKDFILAQNVTGKVTIVSPTPVAIDEAWRIFESVLQVNQLTTVGTGSVMKIIPLREAKGSDISTYLGRTAEQTTDVYVTQVIPLHYITANDMANVLRPFLSSFGNIQPYDPTNTLIITESASNIDRLLKIIRELDTDIYRQTIEVVKLKYATAQSIANIINNLYTGQQAGRPSFGLLRRGGPRAQGQGGTQQPIKVLYDERTNSLILVASADELASIEELVRKLDIPVEGEGQVHVYYLKNANAEKLASTLASLAGGGSAPAVPGHPAAHGPAVAQLAGGVKITADPATNSLIIIATPQDYEVLKGVIRDLDIRRRQVYVQAVIAELSANGTKSLGVDLNAIPNPNTSGAQVGAISNMGAGSASVVGSTNPLGALVAQSGLSLGVINGMINYNGVNYMNIVAFINALETSSQANVLSTPNILATDNEPAEIMVGENIPVPTGQTVGQVSGYAQTFVQRQDVGLKLKITPQINAGDYIRLKLNFQLTSIIPSPQGMDVNTLGITTSKRSAETVVTVKDRSTIVIGGLLDNETAVSESKIPFLGDLPLIGWLFRYSTKTKKKTNLMIFLTPYIIKGQSDIAQINRMKENQSKEFEKETFGYELKNSPFKKTFKEMNTAAAPSPEGPKPLLFTGETYITPQGEFTAGTMNSVSGGTETAAPVTGAAAAPVTGSTGTSVTLTGTAAVPVTGSTGSAVSPTGTAPAPGTAVTTTAGEAATAAASAQTGSETGGTREITATTVEEKLTGTTFTEEAVKPTETTGKP